jgi:Putative zinc-finger
MHPNETAINDYVDEALEPAERREIDRHLESCAACRRLVDDLREVRDVAATLELREPPVRSWTRLERAIKLDQRHAVASKTTIGRAWLGRQQLAWLAAAAALVVATYVGMRVLPDRTRVASAPGAASGVDPSASARADTSAQAVEAELRQAEDHYEKAIKGLEQIANAERNVIDPRTAATLQKNLAVIDQAISESRAALRTEPASEPAQQSLLESFKAKMALLQDTVSLINEMRKGNDAGAARIASGLKQKGD